MTSVYTRDYTLIMELEVKIPTRNISYLQAKLNKLNKRASKLGCPPVRMEDTGKVELVPTGELDSFDRPIKIECHFIKVYGEAPKINGWSFIGTIEHDTEGNMLRTIPGEEMPPTYRTAERHCDHCQKSRTRHHTYIVKSEAGEYKQVGRQCLKDFLGHQSPERLAKHAEWLMDLSASISDEEGNFGTVGRHEFSFDIETYLAWVAYCIENKGWLSRSKQRERIQENADYIGTATADMALRALDPRGKADDREFRYAKTTDEHMETGKKALKWCREELAPTITNQSNEYEYNLVQACKREDVTYRNAGIVASVIISWKKAKDLMEKRKEEAKQFADSTYVGKPGERLTLTVKVLKVITVDALYGPTRIHRMQDEAGNIFIWFAKAEPLNEEETYNIKGTVKSHEIYRDIKQTTLTRCRVLEDQK